MPDIKFFKAVPEDAAELIEYFKKVGAETDYLLMDSGGLLMTVEQEVRYLTEINSKNGIYLIAENAEGKIVAVSNCDIEDKTDRHLHVYTMGVSVLKEYWGRGIGYRMIEIMINMVREKGGEKIQLYVRSDNVRAVSLYIKLGFEIDGTLRKAMKIGHEYYNEYIMSLLL